MRLRERSFLLTLKSGKQMHALVFQQAFEFNSTWVLLIGDQAESPANNQRPSGMKMVPM